MIKPSNYCIKFGFDLVKADGKSIDATQELIALGACNFLSSFVGAVPMSGGLSRGAVSHASGIKTTFGNVYAGKLF